MPQGCSAYPGFIKTGLDPSNPVKVFTVRVLSYDIGPDSGPSNYASDTATVLLSDPAFTYVRDQFNGGSTSLVEVDNGVVRLRTNISGGIGVYNGMWGVNPRGFTVFVTLTYLPVTGRSAGWAYVQLWPVENYGSAGILFDLDGSVTSTGDDILDVFEDAPGSETALLDHVPDVAPLGGGTVGWHGTGAYSIAIPATGKTAVVGCCSGDIKRARLFLGRSDDLVVYGDFLRAESGGDFQGLLARCSEVPGNTEVGLDQIFFWGTRNDNAGVLLSWGQYTGAVLVQQELNWAVMAWPVATSKRLLMRLNGDQMKLYVADEGGANQVLLKTVTLATPWNDADHEYVGFLLAHVGTAAIASFITGSPQLVGPPSLARTLAFDAAPLAVPVPFVSSTAPGFEIDDIIPSIVYADGDGWLAAVLDQATTPATLTVTFDDAGLTAGVYGATVTLSTAAAGNSPVDIAITLTVLPPPPPPCACKLEVFEDDRATVAWEVSTDPNHDTPYLLQPEHYAEQEVDFAKGAASLGTVSVSVIDPATVPGDQATGWMTARLSVAGLAALAGRRCRLSRYIDSELGWVVVADGPAGTPRLDQSYAAYSWDVRDTREGERKVRAFAVGTSRSLLPDGVIGGYGLDPDSGLYLADPVTTVRGFAIRPPVFGGGDHDVFTYGGECILLDVYATLPSDNDEATASISEEAYQALKADVTAPLPGYSVWTAAFGSRLLVRWRPIAGGAWHEIGDPLRLTGSITEYKTYRTDAAALMAYPVQTFLAGVLHVVGTLEFGDSRAVPDLPDDGDEIELQVLSSVAPSSSHPMHLEGLTAGEFARNAYDGLYSPRGLAGELVPLGVRYDEAALLAMTEPVRIRLTAPIDDVRDWLEKYIYPVLGYAPALDNDGRVSPVSQVPPTDLSGLPVVNDAVSEPTPDWDAGQRIVNTLRFSYPRDYAPGDREDAQTGDGLSALTVVIEYDDAFSVARFGEQPDGGFKIDGSAFRAIGQPDSNPLTSVEDERGWQLARDRQRYLGHRYALGAPSIVVPVMREALPDLRAGSWVLVSLSWLPDYVTAQRGVLALGQVTAIADVDCAWRRLTIELVDPLAES